MKNIAALLLFCAAVISSNAQGISIIEGQETGGVINSRVISTPSTLNDEPIEGSAYINETFYPAEISASAEQVFYVRYNAYNDEMEVQGENGKSYALNKLRKDIVINFVAPKKTYQAWNYLNPKGLEAIGYFVVETPQNTEVSLLRKENITLAPAVNASTTYTKSRPAAYKRHNDVFYIRIKDQVAVEAPKKTNDILRLFPKKEKELSTYIKSNRLKVKDEKDLVKLINHINRESL